MDDYYKKQGDGGFSSADKAAMTKMFLGFDKLGYDGGGGGGDTGGGIYRREPFTALASGGAFRRSGRFDGSREQFFVAAGTKVSEVLAALPMLKADPVLASPITVASTTPTLKVAIRYVNGTLTEPAFYTNASAPTALANTLENNAVEPPMGRLGLRFSALGTDAQGTAVATPMNALDWQSQAAAISVLRKLDKQIARGTGAETPPSFYGLATLCSAGVFNRTAATSADIEKDARNLMTIITPNGSGAGEGIDCFIGGQKVLRKLASTSSGQNGASGWRHDPRVGRLVYHYQGIPFYRCECDESTTGLLYGANLGPTGLHLVYATGSAETYGLNVDSFTDPTTMIKQGVVHGAWALIPWEPQCIYEITGISIASL